MSESPEILYITIPAYNELDVTTTLQSIYDCRRSNYKVEVLVFINAKKSDASEVHEVNEVAYKNCLSWVNDHQDELLNFRIRMDNEMDDKHGGVGLARKELMDQAASEIEQSYRGDGLIAALDADCHVEDNYLDSIFNHFKAFPGSPACSIYFEHPLDGKEFPKEVYRGIAFFELHLRYYKNALQYIKYPHYFYTVGSSMVCTSRAYKMQGGMNKRKAGEDFYFLQKMMLSGGYTELNQTCVYPSARPSNRVPFGTGKAIRSFLSNENEGQDEGFGTYSFASFEALGDLFALLPNLYNIQRPIDFKSDLTGIEESLKQFLMNVGFTERLKEFHENSANYDGFLKRFFRWFNPFMVLKYLHFARDLDLPNQPVGKECIKLIAKLDAGKELTSLDTLGLLQFFRSLDQLDTSY